MSWKDSTEAVVLELEGASELEEKLNSVASCRELSSKRRRLSLHYRGEAILRLDVPEGIFNPYGTVGCPHLLTPLLNGGVEVEGKRVVDLGCGSGIVGLTSVHLGASEVLFSDIHPGAREILRHPKFRPDQDRVVIQDLLRTAPANRYDLVIHNPPSIQTGDEIDRQTWQGSVYRCADHLGRVVEEAGRTLRSGGELMLFYRHYPQALAEYTLLLGKISRHFELGELKVHWSASTERNGRLVFSVPRKSRTGKGSRGSSR